ncbi:MAG: beta-glucosidase-related glycosidase [Ruminococcus sp.]|nr:beta-glucosidase-related glycosidase [Ruminococcus sp.]
MKKETKGQIWRGLSTVGTSLLTLSLGASLIVNSFRADIDNVLGTVSTMMVTENQSEADYMFKSDYASTTELLDSIEDLGERMSEEGTVLLKNNGALPLSADETKKLSLLGVGSYFPVMGGDMGSTLTENVGTDADTVDMLGAFQAKGFEINPTLESLYMGLKESFKTERVLPWAVVSYYRVTAPAVEAPYGNIELGRNDLTTADGRWEESMADYNVMLVTLSRAAGENCDYTPDEKGVDPEQGLNQTDPLGLSDAERELIQAAVEAKEKNGGKVIVLLNNANAMEVEELKNNEGIDAMLEIGFPGGYGFYGVADVLSGEANPSGHLADTYVVDNSSSPAVVNYGNYGWTNADPQYSINSEIVAAEGIYTGYKYYETRYADVVLSQGNANDAVGSSTGGAWNYEDEVTYPFGYGLSYTTFSQTLDKVDVNLKERTVSAEVTVTNTGSVAGKSVVQFYVSVPYTAYDTEHQVEKAAIQLLDYGKTGIIEPGQSEVVHITADMQDMASWDGTCENAAGTTGCYILDDGEYYFAIGNDAHDALNNVLAAQDCTMEQGMTAEGEAAKVKTWTLEDFDSETFAYTENGTAVENQLQDMDLNYYMPGTVTYLSRSDWKGTWPKTYEGLTATDEMMEITRNDLVEIQPQGNPDEVVFGKDHGMTLADLKGNADFDDEQWTGLMEQVTLEDCMTRLAFGGGGISAIETITSPNVIGNDGPNGFSSRPLGANANTNEDSKDPCVVSAEDPNLGYTMGTMATQTVIAQTFNKELAAEFGKAVGNYSLWANLALLCGPGINLHRVPYCGRNHEYYSEDSVLSQYQAASYVAGAKEYGLIICPKHFAFNDTEINRSGLATFMMEQSARENGLRAVQGSVEDEGLMGMMTAYNRIGCVAGNAHYGLLMNILRKEWGFKGIMTEDFISDVNYSVLKEAVHAGVTATCNNGPNTMEAVSAKWDYWTIENVGQDEVMKQDVKNGMRWVLYTVANSNAMDGVNETTRFVTVRNWYDNLVTGLQVVFGLWTLVSVVMYLKTSRGKKEEA